MKRQNSVIIVDDYRDIAELVKIHPNKHHCNGYVFDDPDKALDYFKQDPYQFDAIISDVRMPGMSGIEFASWIKKVNPEVKVFLMTAYDIDSIQSDIDSFEYEIVEVFQKPMSFAKVSEKIAGFIKNGE